MRDEIKENYSNAESFYDNNASEAEEIEAYYYNNKSNNQQGQKKANDRKYKICQKVGHYAEKKGLLEMFR